MLPGTPAKPMPAPDGVLRVRDEADLLAAIRKRLHELGVTYDVLDRVAGLPDRFASKLLCDPPIRHISPMTLWLILGALGYDIGLIHNPDSLAKVRGLLSKRKLWNRPSTMKAIARRRMSPWLFDSERAKEMGHLGGLARAAKRNAVASISERNRANALKRWRRAKD
jgi:hypothetical protein